MVTTFYPPHVGGIEYHVEALSRHLTKRGHKVTVLTSMLSRKGLDSHRKASDGIGVYRLKTIFPPRWPYPALSSQGFAPGAHEAIKKIVSEREIDIVHVHGHHYYLSWTAIDAARSLGVPSVMTLHGLYALKPTDFLANAQEEIFNRFIFSRALKKVDATIGLTPTITEYARKYGPVSQNYFTIPNGVDQEIFTSNQENRSNYRRKYGIEDRIVVLFRGRFAAVKGVRELAAASRLVVKENAKVFFLFVGDGPLSGELARLLEPIRARSRILGWSPVDQIHELYIASDIFTLPSKSEALPLTILEAMAARLQIVSTPVGGIPDILESYPYKTYIKEASPTDISASLLNAIDKAQKRKAKPAQHSYGFLDAFRWDKIASQVETVYRIVLGNRLPVQKEHTLQTFIGAADELQAPQEIH